MEVDDPDRFAGRERQVRALTDALHIEGSVPLIYGHRGLGKSSLALQLMRIAMGDIQLLSHFSADHLALDASEEFLIFYVTCTDAVTNLDQLLQVMINSIESIELASAGDAGQATQLVDRTTRRKLTLKVFELESTRRFQAEAGRLTYQELNLEEKLLQLCDVLSSAYGQPILFIIDELDRVKLTSGLASFLKAASGPQLKFLLVGIASSIADLLADHQSLDRRLVPVQLPLMPKTELKQIIMQAEVYLAERGVQLRFTDDAKSRLAAVASGFPWFVHVLGQACVLDASDRGQSIIQETDVARALISVVDNRFAQQFADQYQAAVRDSYPREIALRAFAKWTAADIPTKEIYKVVRRADPSITNASTYRGHLFRDEYGAVLFNPTFQARGLVRFRNEMFKAYVRLRPSIYQDADKRVDEAWEQLNS